MPKVSAKLVGLPALEAKLQALSDQGAAVLMAALRAGALEIQNEARRLVPKRTRTLSRSIIIEEVSSSATAATVRVGPTEPYGKYIEYGTGIHAEGGNGRKTPWVWVTGDGKFITTRGMQPKPFMRPAADTKREKALAKFRRTFRQALEGNG